MHPELVRLHFHGIDRPIYSYGALIVVGVAAGILVGVARAPRFGVPRFDELAVGLLGLVGGLVGAALLYDVVQWRAIVADPASLLHPGLVFYGGLIGGAAAAWAYCRAWRISIADAADAGAPGLALGHAIGRVGCFLGGCCYGRVVDASFPLAVTLHGAPRHPVQLYEAAGLVAIAIVTALLPRRRAGAIFGVYVVAYALLRIVVEHWRGDDVERGVVGGAVSTSQLVGLAVLAAAVANLYRRMSRKGAR
ncbi:MAG TPA: prolipoprotein diacylglyceryl transferase family protein [Polyangia bacterium]